MSIDPRRRRDRSNHGFVTALFTLASFLVPAAAFAEEQAGSAPGGAPPPTSIVKTIHPERQLKQDYAGATLSLEIVLGPVSDAEKASLLTQDKDQPLKIGFGREVPPAYQGDLYPWLSWVHLRDGGQVAAFSIRSPNARAIRVGIRVDQLPGDAEVRFFSRANTEVFGPFFSKGIRAQQGHTEPSHAKQPEGVFWSPVIEGDTAAVEIYLPSPSVGRFVIRAPKIQHLVYSVQHSDEKALWDIGGSGPCNIDISCRTTVPARLSAAVAKIIFISGGWSALCTGTLLNDMVESTWIPYFMTAHHCLSTQAESNTIDSYWFFERATCGGPNPTSVTHFTGGADLLATTATSDATFLRLRDTGVSSLAGIWFSGWTRADPTGLTVVGIHHPSGDLKKWSEGVADGFAPYLGSVDGTGSHIRVRWSQGTTEPGSSGSGLFVSRDERGLTFVGNLHGGGASCSSPASPDYYGRFDLTYPLVRQWLDVAPPAGDSYEPDNSSAQAKPISAGATQTHSINPVVDQDWVTFTLSEPSGIVLETNGAAGDTEMWLYTSSLVQREYDDDDGPGLFSRIELTCAVPLPAGIYYVKVAEFGNDATISSYTLSLQATPCSGAVIDADNDGLPDPWELQFGLSPSSGSGDNGPSGDPDGDGVSNATEYVRGTHPRGFYTRYLAEGATNTTFNTRFALANAGSLTASVNLRFLRRTGTPLATVVAVPAMGRRTLVAKDVPGMAEAEFSTVVESDAPVVVDRTMSWDSTSEYGSHAETSVAGPALTWYLAEGATHSGFDLFYLLQNPNSTAAQIEVTYLRPGGQAPFVRFYSVAANSRDNIWVNTIPELASTDVSAAIRVTNGQPIIVERAMYLSRPGGIHFTAGHDSAGITAPSSNWFLAEGATLAGFNLFYLLANPNAFAVTADVTYLLEDGTTVAKTYGLAPTSRQTIWVNNEAPQLAAVGVSGIVRARNNAEIIVERAMWWPGLPSQWYEAHNSPGTRSTGTKWVLAEGEAGGAHNTETYILVANTSSFAGSARITLLLENGTTAQKTIGMAANSRITIGVGYDPVFGPVVAGKRFGAIVESLGTTPAQIVVERAMYSDANGVHWAAGTNALATRLQ